MHYVPDVDAVFQRAVAMGCKMLQPVTDMFWGDRFGKFSDPFGHLWAVATHTRDVPEAEMAAAAEAFMKQSCEGK